MMNGVMNGSNRWDSKDTEDIHHIHQENSTKNFIVCLKYRIYKNDTYIEKYRKT